MTLNTRSRGPSERCGSSVRSVRAGVVGASRSSGSLAPAVDGVAVGRYLECMRSVGIKVLNSRLSEYVRLATSGETVLVTDRGRVVAELGPLRKTRSSVVADAFLADAVRSGVLAPPALAGSGMPPKPAPVASLDEVLADLDESRRDR